MPIIKEIRKHNVFSMVSAKEKHRTPCVSSFPQKAAQNLSRQKEAAGGFELGTPVSPDPLPEDYV